MINLKKNAQLAASDSTNLLENSAEHSRNHQTVPIVSPDETKEAVQTGLAVWIERFELVKAIVINFIILCVVTSLGIILYHEWQREPVIIEAFAVPESFVQQGYSGAVLANRLMDQVSANQEAAYNRLPDNQKYLFPIEVTSAEAADNLKVDIPETGMSLGVIIQYMRHLRGIETRINGDLVGDKDAFELTIRVNGKPETIKGKLQSLDETLAKLAEYVIENTQPYFLALSYYSKKDYPKTLDLIQKALHNKEKRDDSFAYSLWGNVLVNKKHYEKATEKYNQSININPDNDNPYLGLGYVYYQAYKNYNEAIKNYQIVIKRHPQNYLAYNDLALILADQGDIKAAQDNYKKAIAVNPEYANAYYNLGLIFVGSENYQQAIVQFKKITELPYHAENYFNAYNGLCYSLGKENKYDDAIASCEMAIKIFPKNTNIYDTLGTVYLAQKNYPKALLNYQTAVDYSSDNVEAQQHLAEVLASMRKCVQAQTHLELALKLDKKVDKTGVEKYCKEHL